MESRPTTTHHGLGHDERELLRLCPLIALHRFEDGLVHAEQIVATGRQVDRLVVTSGVGVRERG